MRTLLTIAGKDLRQRLRDRTILLLAFVGPFVVSAVVGLALGSVGNFRVTVAVADLDGSPYSASLADLFRENLSDVVEVSDAADAAAARDAMQSGDASAAVVIPEGFGAAMESRDDAPVTLTVLVDPADPIAAGIVEGASRNFLDGIVAVRLAYATAAETAPGADLGALPVPSGQSTATLAPTAVFQLDPIDYFAPSMGIMFLLFTVMFGAASFVTEEHDHTLARLAVSPTGPGAVIGGKLAAVFVVGLLEMVVLIVSTRLVFGVAWGDPLPLTVLTLTTVFAAVGITGLIAAAARTDEQARSIGGAVIMVLAFVGGQFFSMAGAPDAVRIMQRATPNGASLAGYTELMIAGSSATLSTVWVPVVYTLAVGAAGVLAGSWLLRRRMHR